MTTLSSDTVRWAIEHHYRYADTDLLPKAFEYNAIYHATDDLVKKIARTDICQWSTRVSRNWLTPKGFYGFRAVTQLDPLDMIFYTSLLLETGEDIEGFRVPKGDGIVFSNRFRKDDERYHFIDRKIGFREFQLRSGELASSYPYVLITDIADFFPRIYFHRLENALHEALGGRLSAHVTAIIKLLKSWNQNVSYGIPVGSDPSRLLAELTIHDIDEILIAKGIPYVRYVDDFRIFSRSETEAYRTLSALAHDLYDTHGLTLQASKTRIMNSQKFIAEVLDSEERSLLNELDSRFDDLMHELGVYDPYRMPAVEGMPEDFRAKINNLNLKHIFVQKVGESQIDITAIRFLINRLRLLHNAEVIPTILESLHRLYPTLLEITKYFRSVSEGLSEHEHQYIGRKLLEMLDDSILSQLEYYPTLILSLFVGNSKWGNKEALARLLAQENSRGIFRSLILSLGAAGHTALIRPYKRRFEQFSSWDKRAVLYSLSCLEMDEKSHWYRAVSKNADMLEKAVIDWAKANPINQ